MNHAFGLLNVISQDQLEGILSTFDQLSFGLKEMIRFKSGVSNSNYLGAAGGSIWMRLGRIRYSTKKTFLKKSKLLKCHY